jgi:hypothetical protein
MEYLNQFFDACRDAFDRAVLGKSYHTLFYTPSGEWLFMCVDHSNYLVKTHMITIVDEKTKDNQLQMDLNDQLDVKTQWSSYLWIPNENTANVVVVYLTEDNMRAFEGSDTPPVCIGKIKFNPEGSLTCDDREIQCTFEARKAIMGASSMIKT